MCLPPHVEFLGRFRATNMATVPLSTQARAITLAYHNLRPVCLRRSYSSSLQLHFSAHGVYQLSHCRVRRLAASGSPNLGTDENIATSDATSLVFDISSERKETEYPTTAITTKTQRYSNRVIKWVKLRSAINDTAEAFFKSEARRRTFITVALLMICRAGHFVPLPGFDRRIIPADYLDMDSSISDGGSYSGQPKLSFFQLGLGPYLLASTFMQLACNVYPPFQRIRKDGETEKLKLYIWRLTLLFAVLQAFALSCVTLQYAIAPKKFQHILLTTALMTTGAMLVEGISSTISDAGFAQGSTLIICKSMLISCSRSLHNMVSSFSKSGISEWGPAALLYVGIFLAMTMCAVLVTQGRRILKLQYYGFDVPSTSGYGVSEVEPYIPIDINPTGMLPVLVSSYILSLPAILESLTKAKVWLRLRQILDPTLPPAPGAQPLLYYALSALLIFVFSVLDIGDGPKEISEYLNRIGAKITGVKPGRCTVEFLTKAQNTARAWGGVLLALLVTASTIIDYRIKSFHNCGGISFTAMLFIVGTIIEVRRSFMAYKAMHTLGKVLKRYGV